MAHISELEPHKRKRESEDSGSHGSFPPGHYQQMSLQQGGINYLSNSLADRLSLIQGDAETFSDLFGLILEYEGVLERHESFAASLGAKLTGPRLIKGIEKFFEGSIKTYPPHPFPPISWLDVCTYAKTNPDEFSLSHMEDGTRCCQFVCRGHQTEISEDDWRFISSGALNRLPLDHPMEEDETAELATMDIIEQRTSVLSRKAEELATRARNLHHKVGVRKQDLARRRQNWETESGPRFQSVNQRFRKLSQNPSYDLHQDLLQQFLQPTPSATPSRSASVARWSQSQPSPSMSTSQPQRSSISARAAAAELESQLDIFRPLVTQVVERLGRGESIHPPCDRCRRLRQPCLKHLTACQGCTKKHAKCSWKSATEEEITSMRQDMGLPPIEKLPDFDTEQELVSPTGGTAVYPITTAESIAETPRPESQGTDDPGGGPVAFGLHNILSGRSELPAIRTRTAIPTGQSSGGNAPSTPHSHSSASLPGGERQVWVPSNPPSR
ncbi:unnamed protein product [Clonostachys byssicola]|uniref:Zn(2)-C6 fungal-type domain-containing protein n=1 Tax=Clonostachys byssicola TaxID=160290 RepID=A0A9N9UDD1_9HYPO|nr:unnamed protein product [Clonostachys byssicola]